MLSVTGAVVWLPLSFGPRARAYWSPTWRNFCLSQSALRRSSARSRRVGKFCFLNVNLFNFRHTLACMNASVHAIMFRHVHALLHMHVCAYTCAYTCLLTPTLSHTHTHAYAHTRAHTHTHTHTHTHMHSHMHARTHAHVYVCVSMSVSLCVSLSVSVCVFLFLFSYFAILIVWKISFYQAKFYF